MTARTVPEWIATHPDQAIPTSVKLRIWTRENGRCHLSGRKIMTGDQFEYEHKKPLWLDGEHRESNIFLALKDKHAEKTTEEAGERAKTDRIRAKHLGVYPKSKASLRSKGFEKTRATP